MKTLSELYVELQAEDVENGSDKGTRHSYIEFYEQLLLPYRNKSNLRLLEIGVASGGSALLWARYFPQAIVVGIDIKINVFFREEINRHSIFLLEGSSTDSQFAATIHSDFDIIIDDGSHRSGDQVATYNNFYPKLRSGGVYVIEDFTVRAGRRIHQQIPNGEIIDRRHIKEIFDDQLFIIRHSVASETDKVNELPN